ncbi:ATP-binding protein [Erythrobacter sp. YT30]|uniref:ATP-binding protein n=1 Tax=Erythrobacter sp. YT30 TaxID=1735012 RepID=UPI00076BEE02|nr:ATP-binding protein [Erythrobacter sp. YT30]KWV92836.1 histidine kinase [Erythrobacter sp. YT30]
MDFRHSLPIAGIVLANITIAALIILDVDPIIAISVLIVWVGSLLLASGKPPEPPAIIVEQPISIDSMRKLVENSSTPMLVTERNTIAAANRNARKMLGQHIIGQDARVAFRQPEAISLFATDSNGTAIVRGLVRRQDIWRVNRQSIDDDLAVIELINQTAEADISRAHTDFVANASHELRTPLAAILGYVETLSESSENLDSPTAKKFLSTIQREAERLHSLISDLMSLSRVEAEKHDAPRDKLEFAEVVERAARDAAGSQRTDRLTLNLASGAYVHGDRGQLEQVVRNLVDNALKYGAPETNVLVTLDRARSGEARLCVEDHGEGIAPEHIPHLTRRFYRTDPGRSRASGGTGLGLAIVKHIVERHKGRLDIESKLGKGTRITVRIPIAKSDPEPANVSSRPPERVWEEEHP